MTSLAQPQKPPTQKRPSRRPTSRNRRKKSNHSSILNASNAISAAVPSSNSNGDNTASSSIFSDPASAQLKPPQLIAHLTRLIIKLFYHTKPQFRLILELLIEGPRTQEQVKEMLLGEIETKEDWEAFKEEHMQNLIINDQAVSGGDVIDSEMRSFTLATIDDLTFNPFGSKLTDQEMSKLLDLPLKEVQGFLGKLVLDKLVCIDKKWKPPKTKAQKEDDRLESMRRYKRSKTVDPVLYYIDYVQFINVVKLRLAKLEQSIDRVEQEREVDYACESCGQHYTMFQVGVLADQKCTKCGGLVNETLADQNMTDLAEEKRKFEQKIQPLKDLLTKCQEFVIGDNDRYILPKFLTKAQAERRRREEQRTMEEENRERKKRKRMGITTAKTIQKRSFSVKTSRTPAPGNAASTAESLAAAALSSSNQQKQGAVTSQAALMPHFLNSTRMQMEASREEEAIKKQKEKEEQERFEQKIEQQKQQEKQRQEQQQQLQQDMVWVEEENDEFEDADPMLTVAGESKTFSEITPEDVERMTAEEYEIYEARASQIGGDTGVEMSDDF